MTARLLAAVPLAIAVALSAVSPAVGETYQSEKATYRTVTVASGLDHPWSLAFLPDGRMLVTERAGKLRVITADGTLLPDPVAGVPEVYARGQGGLLEVLPHPDFAANGLVYLSFSEPGDGGASTAVLRGRLVGNERLENPRVIYSATPKSSGGRHFGSRMVWGPDGKLYVTAGERGNDDWAQERDRAPGSVLRLNEDGSIPEDNPFVGETGMAPEIWTWGNRNPQGLIVHPVRHEIWEQEHGPRGGDEINILKPGANYGWPVITYGTAYSGLPMGEGTHKAGMEQPIWYWTPSIAPSGMVYYAGNAFPAWRGNLFVGSLKFRYFERMELDGTKVTHREELLRGELGRIRDVRQGPDGLLYVLTDEAPGTVTRLEPAN
ncbi:MAG: PQQ-dependent sugar dehydrogenase [Alphaproteobacteria bacterium]|jgi:glucose/arabinose dehydrogenase